MVGLACRKAVQSFTGSIAGLKIQDFNRESAIGNREWTREIVKHETANVKGFANFEINK